MVKVISLDNKSIGDIDLPKVFSQDVNSELLKRAYESEQSERFQLKYTDPLAGMRKSTELTKRRRSYKTVYGRGYNRTPKKVLSHVGTTFSYVAAEAPHTVGGREAHPPVSTKVLVKKMNKKEMDLAVRMGISASANKEMVSRFHAGESIDFPIVVDDKINSVAKTKDAEKTLSAIGLSKELERIKQRKIRAGKGKMRGRKYKKKLSLVFVTTDPSRLSKSLSNMNIIVKKPSDLSVSDVTNAGKPGRLLVWTKEAILSLK
jgi:large subunit ribosomal protein L4e